MQKWGICCEVNDFLKIIIHFRPLIFNLMEKYTFLLNNFRYAKRLHNASLPLHHQNKGSMVERSKTALC